MWVIIGGLLIIAVAVIGGVFWWQKSHKTSADVTKTDAKPAPQKDEPVIPKVTQYEVPILMYHYIRNAENEDQLGQNLSVSPASFDKQLKWLKENDYETLTVAHLANPGKIELSKIVYDKKKPIILTFDDGYEDAYTQAFPTLKKYGFIGTFYVIRDYVGKSEYMNQTQIDKLAAAGMEIGSHTLSHPNLTSLDTAAAKNQISNSKDKATTFCYPSGKYNDTIIGQVKAAGYLAAVTTNSGIADQDSDLFQLPRVRIFNGDSLKAKLQ
jgi:peptidoglycan/xylan/chitin deacetylase (PgdA/CDA1 family)